MGYLVNLFYCPVLSGQIKLLLGNWNDNNFVIDFDSFR